MSNLSKKIVSRVSDKNLLFLEKYTDFYIKKYLYFLDKSNISEYDHK